MDNPFFRGSHLRKCGPLFYTFALVGGLLNVVTALLYKGAVNNSDFNSLVTTGYYYIQNNVSNGPNNYWGYLFVFCFDSQIIQMFMPNTNGSDIHIRRSSGSILNVPWYKWSVSQ